jgi:hypothetical protein
MARLILRRLDQPNCRWISKPDQGLLRAYNDPSLLAFDMLRTHTQRVYDRLRCHQVPWIV